MRGDASGDVWVAAVLEESSKETIDLKKEGRVVDDREGKASS